MLQLQESLPDFPLAAYGAMVQYEVRGSTCGILRIWERLLIRLQGYRAAPRPLAAQNFTMPAMSPTMTEGNITSWKVREGPG